MLKIAICESNPQHLLSIKQGVISSLFSECEFVIDTYLNSALFTQNTQKMGEYDIVFLNPVLSDVKGMNTAAKFRNVNREAQLVFVTEDDTYVLDAYKYNAFDYLIKPISMSVLDETLLRSLYYRTAQSDFYTFKSGTGVEKIKLNNIKFFASSGRIVTIHLKKSQREFYAKLDDVEAALSDNRFIRIHKSYLVNMNYIIKMDGQSLLLNDETMLPISRERYKMIKERLLNQE